MKKLLFSLSNKWSLFLFSLSFSTLFLAVAAASAAVTTILVTGDTYTDSSDVINHCSEQTMYVAGESTFYINSWLYASLTALPPGIQIDFAKLYVYPQFISASATIDSKAPSGSWAECTITHSNRPTTSYGVTYEDWNEVSAYQWYWWDVKAIAQEWYSGSKTNYGIRLVPDNITAEPQVKFYTSNYTDPLKRPYFEITYTDIQNPVAVITSPTSDPTYPTGSSSINIAGTASDNVGVTQVSWSNDRGGSGNTSGTTSWSVTGISLYSGVNVITITARDADSNQSTDTLTVTYTLSSTISRSPASMNFSGQQGGANPADQTLSISNSGGGTLNWSVGDDAAWLSLNPTSGSSTGEADSVTVSVNTSGLSAGNYSGTIAISAAGATNTPQTVSVALAVSSSGVSGKITQSDGITPIPGSIVEAIGTGVVKSSSTADVNGNYSLSLATGTYDVKVSSTWYQAKSSQTVNVFASQTTTLNFLLPKSNKAILTSWPDGKIVLLGRNGTPLWEKQLQGVYRGAQSGDLYNNGTIELVVLTASKTYCLDSTNGNTIWEYAFSSAYTDGNRDLHLADVDMDGYLEIIAGREAIYVLEHTGALKWSNGFGYSRWNWSLVEDVDKDGHFEFVGIYADGGGKLGAVDLNLQSVKWLYDTFPSYMFSPSVVAGDVNGDGVKEIYTTSYSNYVKAVSGNGTAYWTSPSYGGGWEPTVLFGGDVNGDGKADIAVGTLHGYTVNNDVYLLNAVDGSPIWSHNFPNSYWKAEPEAVVDNGNGTKDVIVETNDSDNLVRLNGTNGNVVWTSPTVDVSVGTLNRYELVGDLEGDNVYEYIGGLKGANPSIALAVVNVANGNVKWTYGRTGMDAGMSKFVDVSPDTVAIAGTVFGKVTKSDGITAISGATVEVLQGGSLINQTATDASGNYSITAAAGTYDVRASSSGYLPLIKIGISVASGQTTTVNFALLATGDEKPQKEHKTTLGDNLFNPRAGGTSKVKFNVPAAGRVSLKIYDLSGRLIRTLFEGDSGSGDMQKDWDGRDDGGRYVVPSVYFLHYVYPGGKEVRKIGVKR